MNQPFRCALKGDEAADRVNASTAEPTSEHRCAAEMPRWDGEARQLWCGQCLVKQFRRPALNQELVLAALEEEGWPKQIDDPLPPKKHIDPKVRLHDTIKALNRRHLHRIIHFGGDGTGRAVLWRFVRRS